MRLVSALALSFAVIALPASSAEALVPTTRHMEAVAAFPGAVFASTPGVRRPALIVLGGSEGGDEVAKQFAPLFANSATRCWACLGTIRATIPRARSRACRMRS